jgi:outer membrane protein assembly factor BamD (BamD/ComL family)
MQKALLLALPLLLLSAPARADESAESLYQQGRDAAQAQNWELACKKFKESHDREPAPGTLLNLGDCEEHQSKLVAPSARAGA